MRRTLLLIPFVLGALGGVAFRIVADRSGDWVLGELDPTVYARTADIDALLALDPPDPRAPTERWVDFGRAVKAVHTVAAGSRMDPIWVEKLAVVEPKRLRLLASSGAIPRERALAIAVLHAELSAPSDPETARYIAAALIEQKRYDSLLAWVSKGVAGGRALHDVPDLSVLPPRVVEAAWEHGVRTHDHSRRLSEYLVSRGYRPALRWAIWVVDGSARYLSQGHDYDLPEIRYQDILRRYAGFLLQTGERVVRTYSEHWRDIVWDAASRQWQLRGSAD